MTYKTIVPIANTIYCRCSIKNNRTYFTAFVLTLFLSFLWGCSAKSPPPSYPGSKKAPGHTKPYKIKGKYYRPLATAHGFSQKGIASWYGKDFHGRKTANGEIYDMYAMTAAHKTLPIGTWVKVKNLKNGKTIKVRINDRGPFSTGRIIELSYTGEKKIGIVGPGTAPVKITALGKGAKGTSKKTPPSAFVPVNYLKGNFTVQVGAFQDKDNAERLKAKLATRFSNAHIAAYSDPRGTFYRVRVGKFSDLNAAETFSRELMQMGAASAFPVAE